MGGRCARDLEAPQVLAPNSTSHGYLPNGRKEGTEYGPGSAPQGTMAGGQVRQRHLGSSRNVLKGGQATTSSLGRLGALVDGPQPIDGSSNCTQIHDETLACPRRGAEVPVVHRGAVESRLH